jgi:parallel beta-helix repeat protein
LCKKLVLVAATVILLISTISLSTKAQVAQASDVIYIKADGSVSPQTANITTSDNMTYSFTDDNYGEIEVTRSNVIIDGSGYRLDGPGTYNSEGISLLGVENVTVERMNIRRFYSGIFLSYSDYNTISENNITECNSSAIVLYSGSDDNLVNENNITTQGIGISLTVVSNSNTISENNLTTNGDGIVIDRGSDNIILRNIITAKNGTGIHPQISAPNTFYGNNVMNSYCGILFDTSSDNILKNNTLTNNTYNFGVIGFPEDFEEYIDESNSVDGKSILYLINTKDLTIDSQAYPNVGYVGIVSSTNITIRNLSLKSNYNGILLANTNMSQIQNVTISDSHEGICLVSSSSSDLTNNDLTKNDYGISLNWDCSNISIVGNNLTKNSCGVGVGVPYAMGNSNITIHQNDFDGNSETGIWLQACSKSVISENSLQNNGYGIVLTFYTSDCYIVGNDFTNNLWAGITLIWTNSNNSIFHNNLVGNNSGVERLSSTGSNIWDDGYPSGGNYWSDYNGTDAYSGPYQNETGSDWIGDSPYVIDQNNTDRYPLMCPFTSEAEDTGIAYRNLLENYKTLETSLKTLNSTYQQNVLNYSNLERSYISLQNNFNTLNTSYDNLNTTFKDYKTSTQSELSTLTDFLYALATTTAVFIAATAYFALRKPRIKTPCS